MTIPPQKFREIVFQVLYSYDVAGESADAIIPLLMKELSVSKKSVILARDTATAILQKRKEIDAKIAEVSTSYEFSRIQSVERNILRLGVYELLFDNTIPPKVAIAEALRICRKFASPAAASFINAILDALYKQSLGESFENITVHYEEPID
jgi:N utilization substance protein B